MFGGGIINYVILIVAIIIIALILVFYFKFVKIPKLTNLNFICGSIGTGKSLLTCREGIAKFKWRVFVQNFSRKLVYYHLIFIKKLKYKILNQENIEIYTDIPYDLRKLKLKRFDLKESIYQKKKCYDIIEFSQMIEIGHCLREKRFNYKSIVIFDEISVFFDQFDFDDKIVNEKLNNFFKLFRHETKGGLLLINSQSINDLHFSCKNCLNQYFYIHHRKKLFFGLFGSLLYLQELQYSNDNNIVNVNKGDIEDGAKLKVLWVSRKYFKFYDTYAHSWLTDYCLTYNFPYSVEYRGKSRNLWTLKNITSLFDNVPKTELNDSQLLTLDNSNIYRQALKNKKYRDFEKIKKEVLNYEKEKNV